MVEDDDFAVMSSSFSEGKRKLETLLDLYEQRSDLPWKEIKSRTEVAGELLILMNSVAELSSEHTKVLFRKQDNCSAVLISIWLSDVLKHARFEALSNFDIAYKGLDFDGLRYIAKMSAQVSSLSQIREVLLKEFGVMLIFEKSFKGMALDGIVTKLPNGMPVVGLSFRYARYDYFWFTLMHELAHICLHYDLLASPICDDLELLEDSDIEIEANRLAADSLVPRRIWIKAEVHRSLAEADVIKMATQAEIHPAIAAGMIRKKNNNYQLFSNLVNKVDTRGILGIS